MCTQVEVRLLALLLVAFVAPALATPEAEPPIELTLDHDAFSHNVDVLKRSNPFAFKIAYLKGPDFPTVAHLAQTLLGKDPDASIMVLDWKTARDLQKLLAARNLAPKLVVLRTSDLTRTSMREMRALIRNGISFVVSEPEDIESAIRAIGQAQAPQGERPSIELLFTKGARSPYGLSNLIGAAQKLDSAGYQLGGMHFHNGKHNDDETTRGLLDRFHTQIEVVQSLGIDPGPVAVGGTELVYNYAEDLRRTWPGFVDTARIGKAYYGLTDHSLGLREVFRVKTAVPRVEKRSQGQTIHFSILGDVLPGTFESGSGGDMLTLRQIVEQTGLPAYEILSRLYGPKLKSRVKPIIKTRR